MKTSLKNHFVFGIIKIFLEFFHLEVYLLPDNSDNQSERFEIIAMGWGASHQELTVALSWQHFQILAPQPPCGPQWDLQF